MGELAAKMVHPAFNPCHPRECRRTAYSYPRTRRLSLCDDRKDDGPDGRLYQSTRRGQGLAGQTSFPFLDGGDQLPGAWGQRLCL